MKAFLTNGSLFQKGLVAAVVVIVTLIFSVTFALAGHLADPDASLASESSDFSASAIGTPGPDDDPSESVPSESVPSESVPSESEPSEEHTKSEASESVPSESVPSESVPSDSESSES